MHLMMGLGAGGIFCTLVLCSVLVSVGAVEYDNWNQSLTATSGYKSCGFKQLSFSAWCNASVRAFVAESANCPDQTACMVSAGLSDLSCTGVSTCQRGWSSGSPWSSSLCLLIWPTNAAANVLCDISIQGVVKNTAAKKCKHPSLATCPGLHARWCPFMSSCNITPFLGLLLSGEDAATAGTGSSSWDSWKIIVLSVVGGFAALALIMALILLFCCSGWCSCCRRAMGQPGTVAPLPDASNHVKQNVAMGSVTMPVASPALGSPFIDTTNRMGSMSPLIRHGSATYSTMQAPPTPSILIPAGPSMAGSSVMTGHTVDLSSSTASLNSPHHFLQHSAVLGSPSYGFGPPSPGSLPALASPMFHGGHSSMHAPSRLSGAPMYAPLPVVAPGGSDGGFNAAPSMTSAVHRTSSLPAYGFHAASPGSGTLAYAMQGALPSPSNLAPAGASMGAMRSSLEVLRAPSPVQGGHRLAPLDIPRWAGASQQLGGRLDSPSSLPVLPSPQPALQSPLTPQPPSTNPQSQAFPHPRFPYPAAQVQVQQAPQQQQGLMAASAQQSAQVPQLEPGMQVLQQQQAHLSQQQTAGAYTAVPQPAGGSPAPPENPAMQAYPAA